jgi:molybdenum cofactor cytidylyltransferase
VRVVAETALAAGLDLLLVVTGAYQQDVTHALEGLPIQLIHNRDWEHGQSTSVKAAIKFLQQPGQEEISAAMFLLVDQPQIPVTLVRALMNTYAKSLSPIVAPLVDRRRGNPVLFDQVTFTALSDVEGDAGGRQVFSKFPLLYLPWLDLSAALDVDTEEDYRRLLEEG